MTPERDITIKSEPDESLSLRYSITSYGADFDVEGLVRRISRQDIYVPPFQRRRVWNIKQASRFVESLLLGLPVPGIFLSKDGESRHLVIDGQQRLRSLEDFYSGIFEPTGKKFALTGLKSPFSGLTYKDLAPEDKRRLDDSIIHATIIRQDYPDDGNSSIYFVFERLNTGGTQLQPQEIRAALYHGGFNDVITKLNMNSSWRALFGPIHSRRRDQELILRFLALHFQPTDYQKPMKEFLSSFMGGNREMQRYSEEAVTEVFMKTVSVINGAVGSRAFKPKRSLNAAILDSVMVGVAANLRKEPVDQSSLLAQYQQLLRDPDYQRVTETATTDEENVRRRLSLSIQAFSSK